MRLFIIAIAVAIILIGIVIAIWQASGAFKKVANIITNVIFALCCGGLAAFSVVYGFRVMKILKEMVEFNSFSVTKRILEKVTQNVVFRLIFSRKQSF